MNASYLHGKWNDMFRVGRSDNVCDNERVTEIFLSLDHEDCHWKWEKGDQS